MKIYIKFVTWIENVRFQHITIYKKDTHKGYTYKNTTPFFMKQRVYHTSEAYVIFGLIIEEKIQ